MLNTLQMLWNRVALLADLIHRLFEKTVVVTAVRVVTFDAGATIHIAGIRGCVLIREWTTLFRMTILARAIITERIILVCPV